DIEPLLDLALAFGRPSPEPLLELLLAGGSDEDRDRPGDVPFDLERAAGLDFEQRREAVAANPIEFGPQRPRPVALAPGQGDAFEEAVLCKPPVEFFFGDEPIVASVFFARPARTRGGRDRELELRKATDQVFGEGAFSLARRPRYYEDRRLSSG